MCTSIINIGYLVLYIPKYKWFIKLMVSTLLYSVESYRHKLSPTLSRSHNSAEKQYLFICSPSVWFSATNRSMDDECAEIEEQRPVAAAGSSYMLVSDSY